MKPLFTAAQGRILRALVLFLSKDREFSGATVDCVVVEAFVSQDWASLTFAGERHHLVLRLPAAMTGDIDLDAIKIDLPGSIIAVEWATWEATDAGLRLTLDLLAIDTAPWQSPSSV